MTKRKLVTLGFASITILSLGSVAVAHGATRSSARLTTAQRSAKYQTRLDRAVKAGKITTAQETAILAEHAKLEAELAAATATGAERRSTRTKVVTEAKTWAKANNLKAYWLLTPRHLRGAHIASPSPTPSS